MLSASYDDRRRTLKCTVAVVGADLGTRVAREMQASARKGALVAHADLRLSDTASGYAVDVLRELGFFFSGLLPEYHDGDILRMQWVDDSVDVTSADVIALDSTRAIEAFVLGDRP